MHISGDVYTKAILGFGIRVFGFHFWHSVSLLIFFWHFIGFNREQLYSLAPFRCLCLSHSLGLDSAFGFQCLAVGSR